MEEFAVQSLSLLAASRRLLHGSHDDDEDAASSIVGLAPSPSTAEADVDGATGAEHLHQNTHVLKWVFAAIIFAESFIGILLPILLRWRGSVFQSPAFLSLLNCFAGGVFVALGEQAPS